MRAFFEKEYWQVSRTTTMSLIFAVPLWVVYEYLAYRMNNGLGGTHRTGVDLLFTQKLLEFSLPLELSVALPAVLLCAFFIKKRNRLALTGVRIEYLAGMFLECLLYGIIFGLLVGGITGILLTPIEEQMVGTFSVSALVMNIGSGIYEEFLFRFVLLSAIILALRKLDLQNKVVVYGLAIFVSSLAFAGFHYLDPFPETFDRAKFTFRAVAGAIFSLLFVLRGYGITAYTHSLYNIFLMLR